MSWLICRGLPFLLLVTIASAPACGDESGTPPGVDANGDASPSDAAPPDANPNAPTCVITAPADGTRTAFDVPVMFMAMATDPQDGTLGGASVVWRSSLQVAPLGSGTTFSTTLPPGTNVVSCIATDSNGNTGSASITIVSRSPVAQINHPGDGETRPASQAVPFVGVGRDLEDGTLSGSSLVWTSSIDGMIGTGGMFSRQLSAGTHTITLTAKDSANNMDSVSITLIMTP